MSEKNHERSFCPFTFSFPSERFGPSEGGLGAKQIEGLGTIVITKAKGALAVDAVGPESSQINIGLWDPGVGEEQPNTKDGFGQEVEHGIGDDFGVDRNLASTLGECPDTRDYQ